MRKSLKVLKVIGTGIGVVVITPLVMVGVVVLGVLMLGFGLILIVWDEVRSG